MMMMSLFAWLEEGEQEEESMADAAQHLKDEFGADQYREYLRAGGFSHLSHAVSYIKVR